MIIMRLPVQPMPRCSAIIVTYNSGTSITACLEALATQDCEIVVVDNSSEDDSVAKVKAFAAKHPVQLVLISRNVGFAAGVNQGARTASGEVLLLLNPDAVAGPGAIDALLSCLRETSAGAAGGALLRPDGTPDRGFAFRALPNLRSLLFECLLINRAWPGNPINRRYRCLEADYSRVQPVEQPAGACLAITREAWDAVAGMDAQFGPVWFEDVDLCKRILESGCKIVYCPSARFYHAGAHSVGKLTFAEKQVFWYTNMLRYARKHFSPWKVLVLRWAIAKGMALRWLATLFGKGPRDVTRREATRVYWRVALLALGHSIRSA